MSIHSTPAFDSIDSTICTTPASENTDKWHNEYVRVSRELSALQKQFHGILKENYDLKVENHTLRGDLKWAIGLNM